MTKTLSSWFFTASAHDLFKVFYFLQNSKQYLSNKIIKEKELKKVVSFLLEKNVVFFVLKHFL